MRRTTLLAGFSAATLLTGMAFAHANPTGPKGEGSYACPAGAGQDEGFTVTWTPKSVFPPNHKYITGTLTYTAPEGHEDDELTLGVDAILHDEVHEDGTEANGTGNTPLATDATWDQTPKTGKGSLSVDFQVRAERAGGGDGRTYSVGYTAKAQKTVADQVLPLETNNCSQTVTDTTVQLDVPHDMGKGNDN
jgi:hypothetical protein